MAEPTIYEKYDDKILWEHVRKKDIGALGVLYKRHYELLLNFGMKFYKEEDFVKDCIQDLFLHIYNSGGKLGVVHTPRGYLLKALRNLIFDRLKAKHPQEELSNIKFEIEINDAALECIFEEGDEDVLRISSLMESFNKLPQRQQAAIYLRFVRKLSYKEIGEALNLKPQSSMNLVMRAMKNLRQKMNIIHVSMRSKKKLYLLLVIICGFLVGCNTKHNVSFYPQGELKERIERNKHRLEGGKYIPEKIFLTEEESWGWPGDTEGRTILGLVCDSKSIGIQSPNLKEIVSLIPSHLNESGYMGTDHGDIVDEQQLSGHGWMLRGLCAYYRYTGDDSVLKVIRSISENLFVRHRGKYSIYPIVASERSIDGGASGHISMINGVWRLSSDIGCVFIGLDGLVDAYTLIGGEAVRSVIEEMIDRFLEMDIVEIKAQAHASLTGCRALLRYAELTGDKRYIEEVQKRWALYKEYCMTENYANYNWFERYDTWTEPCAIVDSYILAIKLWELTSDIEYLEDSHLIWYNALCHAQRHNGGFGCDTCPGEASGYDLSVFIDEAHWCCTMRGAEALSSAVESVLFQEGKVIKLASYHDGVIDCDDLKIRIKTDYPHEGVVALTVLKGEIGKNSLEMFKPGWMNVDGIRLNGKATDDFVMSKNKDFLILESRLKKGDELILEYSFESREEDCINRANSPAFGKRSLKGPLVLDDRGRPIYHVMSPFVNKADGYRRCLIHGSTDK